MRVDLDRSRNGYRSHYGKKLYEERLKRRNYRDDDYHIRATDNLPSRPLEKPRRYHDEEYLPANRTANDHVEYCSARVDRQSNNRDSYTPLLADLSGGPSPAALHYNSSTRERNSLAHYAIAERTRYSSSSSYRRDASPVPSLSSSTHREDYLSRHIGNDFYARDEYRSPTPSSLRSSTDTYNETYQADDYNSRSERYDITPNRNGSSRDYAIASIPASVYRSDPYRSSSSSIPLSSSSSSPPPLTSSSSLYVTREQYVQALPSAREIDYRSGAYGMPISTEQRPTDANKSSDRYYTDPYRPSYADRSTFKRARSTYIESERKRPARRWEK